MVLLHKGNLISLMWMIVVESGVFDVTMGGLTFTDWQFCIWKRDFECLWNEYDFIKLRKCAMI